MPHVCPPIVSHHALEPVRLEPPVHMANGPMYVIYYPCPCGLEPCVQPVLVNSHHVRAMQAAQNVLNQHVVPPNVRNQRIPNEFGNAFVVEEEGPRLEYPTYPEVQPREYRRRDRARRRRNIEENVSLSRDDDCEVDRWVIQWKFYVYLFICFFFVYNMYKIM